MSAAEKLAALVEEFWEDTAPSGHEAPVEVVRALPQIVAVVQSAEKNYKVQTEVCDERGEKYPDWLKQDGAALAALDEALS